MLFNTDSWSVLLICHMRITVQLSCLAEKWEQQLPPPSCFICSSPCTLCPCSTASCVLYDAPWVWRWNQYVFPTAQLVLACSRAAEELPHRCCEMPHSLWGCPKHMLSSVRRGTWPMHPQLNLPSVLCAQGGSSATFSTSGCCFLWTYSRCCCLLGAEPKPWQNPACFGILSNSPGPDSIALVFATKSAWSRTKNIHSPSPVPKSLSTVLLQQWMSSITQQLGKVILSAQIFIRGTYGKCLHSWHFSVFTSLNKTPQ